MGLIWLLLVLRLILLLFAGHEIDLVAGHNSELVMRMNFLLFAGHCVESFAIDSF
jgi:hypothetical protein